MEKINLSNESCEDLVENVRTDVCSDLSFKCGNDLEDSSVWTNTLLEEWIKEIETSMDYMSNSAHLLVEMVDQVCRRVTARDVGRIVQPRDDLIRVASVAEAASKELHRWGLSAITHGTKLIHELGQIREEKGTIQAELKRIKVHMDEVCAFRCLTSFKLTILVQ
ncbi:unnamed protein product [Protopolystoma xenopodis]|uniref:Uncharacterized protein n=1 Tax=Protopolystoma xenopodis TaxID=117903 RepID=A0A448XAC6_9PLAT|nr:unnamed protein product [Protopolystoma xenopodis]